MITKGLMWSLVLAVAFVFSTSFAEEKVDAKKLFDNHCKKCHGELGKPTERGQSLKAPDFTDRKFQEAITDAQIRASINNGKNKMPSWKDILSPEEMEAVAKWVRVFKPRR